MAKIRLTSTENLWDFALEESKNYKYFGFFEGYEEAYPFGGFETRIALGAESIFTSQTLMALEELDDFLIHTKKPCVIGISYECKDGIEALQSAKTQRHAFPLAWAFTPQLELFIENGHWHIEGPEALAIDFVERLNNYLPKPENPETKALRLDPRFSQEEYVQCIEKLRQHIEEGDFYEINFCMEFYKEQAKFDPWFSYKRLREKAKAPFAGFFRFEDGFILSASPERFLQRKAEKLLAQPIKGTRPRGGNELEDKQLREELRNDSKEISENMMIVDLVRNDLARVSKTGSVKVDELFGIYSFSHVHQMISSISSSPLEEKGLAEILKANFPMGSMTGAPKIMVMKCIEQYERSRREMYSGSVGFYKNNETYDFNVLIRSIFYNIQTEYLSYQVGSAITYEAEAHKEYEECLTKSRSLQSALVQAFTEQHHTL